MQNQHDLFDNPMVRNILKQMSPEEIEKYKQLGEELYGNMNMMESISEIVKEGITAKENNSEEVPTQIKDSISYILEGLKSGLLPSDLDEDEKNILREYLGEEWYKTFGYNKSDL
jgi:hypothetical protein